MGLIIINFDGFFCLEVKMNYIGEKCFCCNKIFDKDDDVVVCPECGTPYHRECYMENKRCVNTELHKSGDPWKRSLSDAESEVSKDESGQIICRHCLCRNPAGTEKCTNCGMPLKELSDVQSEDTPDLSQFFSEFDAEQKYFGFNPDEDFDGARLEEVSSFVKTNTIYYLPLFKKMKDIGTKISFNIICLFFPQFYFANRKMWFMAIFALIFSLLMNVPSFISQIPDVIDYNISLYEKIGYAASDYGNLNAMYDAAKNFVDSNQKLINAASSLCTILNYAFKFIMCLFGNWYYYKFTIKSIKKIKNSNPKIPLNTALQSAGGTNAANIAITAVIYFVLYSAVIMIFYELSAII